MERQILDPIHLPCPDMAGCINPDPQKTQNSLSMVQKLREKYGLNGSKSKRRVEIPARFFSPNHNNAY
ncbi:hypothetical protein ATY36_11740 [Vibrio cidicii]|uniref:hypothetical protein n=1 Tax=Vibrio cidicii TaxID=1763883 RepID=UPI00079ACFE6|nr:hypothetical protein [Vibrio cidicii]KYN83509.1 hypothetical protein ATY36_11740 [Vibrio cidicii]